MHGSHKIFLYLRNVLHCTFCFQQVSEQIPTEESATLTTEDGASQAANGEEYDSEISRELARLMRGIERERDIHMAIFENQISNLRTERIDTAELVNAFSELVISPQVKRILNDAVTREVEMAEGLTTFREATETEAEEHVAAENAMGEMRMAYTQNAAAVSEEAQTALTEARRRVKDIERTYDEARSVANHRAESLRVMIRTQTSELATAHVHIASAMKQHFRSRSMIVDVKITKDQVGKCFSFVYFCQRSPHSSIKTAIGSVLGCQLTGRRPIMFEGHDSSPNSSH